VQAHVAIAGALVQGDQLLAMWTRPGKKRVVGRTTVRSADATAALIGDEFCRDDWLRWNG